MLCAYEHRYRKPFIQYMLTRVSGDVVVARFSVKAQEVTINVRLRVNRRRIDLGAIAAINHVRHPVAEVIRMRQEPGWLV